MIKQKLNLDWKMRSIGEDTYIHATVPGSVYGDLLNAGKIKDPFWKDNELEVLKIMEKDYEYIGEFSAKQEILNSDTILLHCDGLDTLADLYLNNVYIGSANNMHRTWEYNVKQYLKNGKNELKIVFPSSLKYIKEQDKKFDIEGSDHAIPGFNHLRKAHYSYGWDWGPRIPDAGIWRDITLFGINEARIDSVYITQHHEANRAIIDLMVEEEKFEEVETKYNVILTMPDGSVKLYKDSPKNIIIDNPELWWPNGFGQQNLYGIEVILMKKDIQLDSWNKRIGLRTMKIHKEKDEWGESFAHEVNGVQIFAMGADYIPEDNLLGRVTPETTRKLLMQCKSANFNAIRVWGGGYYPDDWFYDICDELGFIIWQDFMFACSLYPFTEEFEENVTKEVIDNVKRIRHHASLGLWCGNNEMEWFVVRGRLVKKESEKADYIKMYEYVIPKIVKKYDPNAFYWPASPSSGGSFDNPNNENMGDAHYWGVFNYDEPISTYRNYKFRYLSEFGFQSFPTMKTIESFTDDPNDMNIFSYVMDKHQRRYRGNAKIMNYMYHTYLYPTKFSVLLYASQLLQADALKYAVEHYRRHRGRCMGTIYWQLNDCWPVASWASIDYCGRWKASHYYAKRFFAPVLLSCQEEGILTQDDDPNAVPYDVQKSIWLNVSNETMFDRKVTVKWALRNTKSEILRRGEQEVTVNQLSAIWLDKIDFPEANLYTDYASYELYENGGLLSLGTVIFSVPKHFKYLDPELSYEVDGDEIIVKAKTYAKGVEILNEQEDMLLSDNYFDMNAGERRVKILSGEPQGIKLRSVYDIR